MKKLSLFVVFIASALLARSQDYIKPGDGEAVIADIVAIHSNNVEFKIYENTDTTTYFMKKENIQGIGFYPSFTKEMANISKGSELIKSQSSVVKDYLILKDETITPSHIDSIRNGTIYFHIVQDTTSYFIQKSNITGIVFSSTPVTFKKAQASKSGTMNSSDSYKKGVADAKQFYKGYMPAAIASYLVSWTFYGLAVPIATSYTEPKESNMNYPDPELMENVMYYAGYTKTVRKMKKRNVWIAVGLSYVTLFGVAIVIAATQAH